MQLSKKGHEVTIVAKHLPGDYSVDYTSPWAGAFWIHLVTRRDPSWLEELQDIASYYEILEIAAKDKSSGVWEKEVNVFIPRMSLPEPDYDGPWFKDLVRDYEIIRPENYPPGSAKDDIAYGFKYTGFMITPTTYLSYLLSKCVKNGCKYIRKTVKSLTDARDLFMEDNEYDVKLESSNEPTFGLNNPLKRSNQKFSSADLVINCTGLHAPNFVPKDAENNMPIKGQTLLVENNVEKLIIVEPMDEEFPTESLYILPRQDGGTLLTGTYLYNDKSTHFNPLLTDRIKERSIRYAPEIVNTNFMKNEGKLIPVREMIGIRPGRKNGPMIKKEILENDVNVIHNYGSGANGYQNSFGLAKRVTQLVDDFCYENKFTLKSKL